MSINEQLNDSQNILLSDKGKNRLKILVYNREDPGRIFNQPTPISPLKPYPFLDEEKDKLEHSPHFPQPKDQIINLIPSDNQGKENNRLEQGNISPPSYSINHGNANHLFPESAGKYIGANNIQSPSYKSNSINAFSMASKNDDTNKEKLITVI